MVESVRVSKSVPTSTGKGSNQCEYRKMVEYVRAPEKGRICVTSEKWWNLGEYREKLESMRVSKKCPDEY